MGIKDIGAAASSDLRRVGLVKRLSSCSIAVHESVVSVRRSSYKLAASTHGFLLCQRDPTGSFSGDCAKAGSHSDLRFDCGIPFRLGRVGIVSSGRPFGLGRVE